MKYLRTLEEQQVQAFDQLNEYVPSYLYKMTDGGLVVDDDEVNGSEEQIHYFDNPAAAWKAFYRVVNCANSRATAVRYIDSGGSRGWFSFSSRINPFKMAPEEVVVDGDQLKSIPDKLPRILDWSWFRIEKFNVSSGDANLSFKYDSPQYEPTFRFWLFRQQNRDGTYQKTTHICSRMHDDDYTMCDKYAEGYMHVSTITVDFNDAFALNKNEIPLNPITYSDGAPIKICNKCRRSYAEKVAEFKARASLTQ